MRYLKRFNETVRTNSEWDSIETNIKDIFVEYQDSHELEVDFTFYNQGIGLPSTLMHLDDSVTMVLLRERRGIRFSDISDEVAMLIEYMKSLTDKEVKIYYELDNSGLRSWVTFGNDGFDYFLQKSMSRFNTLKLYFLECVHKVRVNESCFVGDKIKVISDIDDMFIDLKDKGLTYLVSSKLVDGFKVKLIEFDIIIYSAKNINIDLDWFKDPIEMVKDYLSDLGDFKEIYKIGITKSSNTDRAMFNRGTREVYSLEDLLLFKERIFGVYELDTIKITFTEKNEN